MVFVCQFCGKNYSSTVNLLFFYLKKRFLTLVMFKFQVNSTLIIMLLIIPTFETLPVTLMVARTLTKPNQTCVNIKNLTRKRWELVSCASTAIFSSIHQQSSTSTREKNISRSSAHLSVNCAAKTSQTFVGITKSFICGSESSLATFAQKFSANFTG